MAKEIDPRKFLEACVKFSTGRLGARSPQLGEAVSEAVDDSRNVECGCSQCEQVKGLSAYCQASYVIQRLKAEGHGAAVTHIGNRLTGDERGSDAT